MDLKLTASVDGNNPVENDLYLDPGTGDLVWLGSDGSTDGEEVAQHIRVRLRFWQGEWFIDTDEGVPYLQNILDKGLDDGRIANILRQVILGTPGVAAIASLTLSRDNAARNLNVVFVCTLDSGHVLNSNDFGPFVVNV